MANDRQGTIGDLVVQSKIANRLLAAQLKERLGQQEIVGILLSVGATNQEIADVLGTSADMIKVTKARLKANGGKKNGRSRHGKGKP